MKILEEVKCMNWSFFEMSPEVPDPTDSYGLRLNDNVVQIPDAPGLIWNLEKRSQGLLIADDSPSYGFGILFGKHFGCRYFHKKRVK